MTASCGAPASEPSSEPPVATPPAEAQNAPHGPSAAPVERPVDGGRPAGASDAGDTTGRPGDARAQELAGQQPEAEPAVSSEPGKPKQPGKRRPAQGGPDVSAGGRASIGGDDAGPSGGVHAASHVDTADNAVHADVAAAEARGEQPRHFVIDDVTALTEASWPSKLDANLAAIRLLKALTLEDRPATDAEQAILARYVGWGTRTSRPLSRSMRNRCGRAIPGSRRRAPQRVIRHPEHRCAAASTLAFLSILRPASGLANVGFCGQASSAETSTLRPLRTVTGARSSRAPSVPNDSFFDSRRDRRLLPREGEPPGELAGLFMGSGLSWGEFLATSRHGPSWGHPLVKLLKSTAYAWRTGTVRGREPARESDPPIPPAWHTTDR